MLAPVALGAASAFAFEPVGWWPLMPLAFAGLCELLARAGSLKQALLTGWLFGLGQFVIGLNWIATAFTYQAAMPAWLGWIAVVLLSLYLALFPMLAAGLAWRIGRDRPMALILALAGAWALTEWVRAGTFHRLRLESGRGERWSNAAQRPGAAGRHLRPCRASSSCSAGACGC